MFFKDPKMKILLSIVWGLGLASLFKKVCKGRNCIIYRAPLPNEIKGKIFKFNDKCYQYKPKFVECKGKNITPHEEFKFI